MDVGRVISDISLLAKVDSAGNIYYEFPDSHLFYSLEYINALVTKHLIISCKQFWEVAGLNQSSQTSSTLSFF